MQLKDYQIKEGGGNKKEVPTWCSTSNGSC